MSKKILSAQEIHRKYYSCISDDDFRNIISADTVSSNLQKDKLGKYAKWLLGLYIQKRLKLENLFKATEYIVVFDKTVKMKKLHDNDLNHYKSLSEMHRVIKPFIKTKSKTEKKKTIKKNEAEKVYEDSKFMVICPKTEAASILYGKGTQWCTAAKHCSNFLDYYGEGNLYIVINKYNGIKYQFQTETESFMDENNVPINYNEFRKTEELSLFYFLEKSTPINSIQNKRNSTLKEIKPTPELLDFFLSKMPYLYHEYLFEKKYGFNRFEMVNIDLYCEMKCEMRHEFGYNSCVYYIFRNGNICTLHCLKSIGEITGFIELIGTTFGIEEIIPCKEMNRQNEVIIMKNNQYGIYNIDTDSIRWGYKGSIDNNIDWIENNYAEENYFF